MIWIGRFLSIPVAEIVSRLGIDVTDGVQRFVLSAIPDSISFSAAQLRTALVQAGAGDNLDQLDEVREILREGWSYNQDDLSRDLIQQSGDFDVLVYSDPVELLDDVRAFLKDGWTYTDADFRNDISEESGRQPWCSWTRSATALSCRVSTGGWRGYRLPYFSF